MRVTYKLYVNVCLKWCMSKQLNDKVFKTVGICWLKIRPVKLPTSVPLSVPTKAIKNNQTNAT